LSDERHDQADGIVMCWDCGKVQSVGSLPEQRWEQRQLAISPPLADIVSYTLCPECTTLLFTSNGEKLFFGGLVLMVSPIITGTWLSTYAIWLLILLGLLSAGGGLLRTIWSES
jgi:hypothetical protein